nr:hypothetical protein [Actinomycetota bacterium]
MAPVDQSHSDQEDARSLLDWLRTIRDGWVALALCIVVGLGLGVAVTASQKTSYRSTGSVVVTPARGFLDPQDADKLPGITDTVGRLVQTAAVRRQTGRSYVALARGRGEAARRRAQASQSWVGSHVSATQEANSSILTIRGTAPSRAEAQDLTTAAVRALALVVNASASTIGVLPRPVQPGASRPSSFGIAVRGFPVTSDGKVSPTPTRNLIIGGNAGALIGIIAALLLGLARRRLRRPEDVEEELGVPVLGVVEASRKRGAKAGPGLDAVRARLEELREDSGGGVFLLTGTTGSRRVAAVAEGIARSLDVDGSQAVVVDADFRGQSVSRLLSVTGQPGLTDMLNGDDAASHDDDTLVVEAAALGDRSTQVRILPAGQSKLDGHVDKGKLRTALTRLGA